MSRLALNAESAEALGVDSWYGWPPPFAWIVEHIAPQFGYKQGRDTLPVFEYYGLKNEDVTNVANAWLYVPVEKTAK